MIRPVLQPIKPSAHQDINLTLRRSSTLVVLASRKPRYYYEYVFAVSANY